MNINELLNKANELIGEAQGVIQEETQEEVQELNQEEAQEEAQGDKEKEIIEKINNKIELIKDIEGIHISQIGVWLWIDGETMKVKEELKNAGLKYSSKNKCWYYNANDEGKYKKYKRKYTKEEKAQKYGETIIK